MDLDKCLVCCWILQQTFAQIETWLIFFQQKNNDISSHGRCTCWAFSLPRSSRRCSRLFRVPRRSSQKLGAQTYLVTAKVAKIQIGWTLRLPRKKKNGKKQTGPVCLHVPIGTERQWEQKIEPSSIFIQMKSDFAGIFFPSLLALRELVRVFASSFAARISCLSHWLSDRTRGAMIKEKSPRTDQGRATTMKVPITYLQIVLL